jgi:hypothetical protein
LWEQVLLDSPVGYSGVFHVKKRISVPHGVLVGPLKKL